MSKSELAIILSKLNGFENPKTNLEQYLTPSEIAATVLWEAHMQESIKEKNIIDLGAGTGILGIGAMILGAKKVEFLEIDSKCVDIIKKNIRIAEKLTEMKLEKYKITNEDLKKVNLKKTDLIITNPPFGTKEKKIDTKFLEKSMTKAKEIISFHKTATDNHIEKLAKKNGFLTKDKFLFVFNLKKTMEQHRKKKHPVKITAWFFTKK